MADTATLPRHLVSGAPAGRWPLRISRCVAEFTLRSRGLLALRGRFPAASGTLVVAPDPECSQLSVDLDVSGMRTNHPFTAGPIMRVLNVETFDIVRFQSTSVALRGTDRLRLVGQLEVGNRTVEANFGARVLRPDPLSLIVVGASSVPLPHRGRRQATLALMLAADFGREDGPLDD